MSIRTIVVKAISIVNNVTSSLQANVTLEAWLDSNLDGSALYDLPVTLKALVEGEQKRMVNTESEEVVSTTKITIIGPVADNGAPGRREPIDPRDRLTMPDGITAPIIMVKGLIDPLTTRPYLFEIWL